MVKFAPLNLTAEEIIQFTPEWSGERSADGRPRVSDDILLRMRSVTVTQAWSVMRREGYHWQYEGGWQCTQPGKTLVGRAVTVSYLPRREDLRKHVFALAHESGCVGDQVTWPIEPLVRGDVYVADIMGKIADGAAIGDNLATSILTKSGNGVVHDGSIRDIDGVKELTDFVGFCRGYHPSVATATVVLGGINCPIRIGGVTVMPGDVVLAREDGVVFIPPQFAEPVVLDAEATQLRDIFGKKSLAEGRFSPGEIDRKWDPYIEDAFLEWLAAPDRELPVPASTIAGLLNGSLS
ncbi:MAG: RraA family protein [Anaerolineae bacterium]